MTEHTKYHIKNDNHHNFFVPSIPTTATQKRLSLAALHKAALGELCFHLDALAVQKVLPSDQATKSILPTTSQLHPKFFSPRDRLDEVRTYCHNRLLYKGSLECRITASTYVVTHHAGRYFVLLCPHPRYGNLLLSTGGHLEKGETFLIAALRERQEELSNKTLQKGSIISIPFNALPPCPLTGERYKNDHIIFDIGVTQKQTLAEPSSFDIRIVEFVPNANTARSYPHVHEDIGAPCKPDFAFFPINDLIREGITSPNQQFLKIDPTYYQRFVCLQSFIRHARTAKVIP